MKVSKFSLHGQTVVVTGAKRGIGKAIAVGLAEAGANVALATHVIKDSNDDLNEVAAEINRLGNRSLVIQTDVTQKADVDSLVQRVMDEFGKIDILVNNAGILVRSPLLELPEHEWDSTIATHLKGSYLCCQAVGREMVKRKSGCIINIASNLAFKAVPSMVAYCAAKAGIVMLTRVLAVELGAYNIRVNAVGPGVVRTKMTDYIWSSQEVLEEREAQIPLARIAEPDDVVGAVLFLASDASAYVTGHTIIVDGGRLA